MPHKTLTHSSRCSVTSMSISALTGNSGELQRTGHQESLALDQGRAVLRSSLPSYSPLAPRNSTLLPLTLLRLQSLCQLVSPRLDDPGSLGLSLFLHSALSLPAASFSLRLPAKSLTPPVSVLILPRPPLQPGCSKAPLISACPSEEGCVSLNAN